MTPVPELYEMTLAPESDVEEILLLKVLKSVELRYPLAPVLLWVMAHNNQTYLQGFEVFSRIFNRFAFNRT
jgi:hypothetical protein